MSHKLPASRTFLCGRQAGRQAGRLFFFSFCFSLTFSYLCYCRLPNAWRTQETHLDELVLLAELSMAAIDANAGGSVPSRRGRRVVLPCVGATAGRHAHLELVAARLTVNGSPIVCCKKKFDFLVFFPLRCLLSSSLTQPQDEQEMAFTGWEAFGSALFLDFTQPLPPT